MQHTIKLNITLMLGVVLFSCAPEPSSKTLFEENGNDYTIEGDAQWRFEKNELVGSLSEGSGFVMTKESYGNFILELEFKPDSTINSGIFIRCQNRELSFEDCYEINIWDLHPKQEFRTGAVVSRFSPLEKLETLNRWNRYKIRNQNDHLQAWINEVLVVDLHDPDLIRGPIALQAAEKGEIRFRDVRIAKLD